MTQNLPSPEDVTLEQLQAAFNVKDMEVKAVEPQVAGMKATYEEAQMILDNMRKERGRLAYWLTIRKAQR